MRIFNHPTYKDILPFPTLNILISLILSSVINKWWDEMNYQLNKASLIRRNLTLRTTSMASEINPNHPPFFCTAVSAEVDAAPPERVESTATAASASV